MMKHFNLSIIVALLWACSSPAKEQSLEGFWTLHIMEQKDSVGNWKEWRDGMQGYLLYDGEENMALHLLEKEYETYADEFPNFSDTIALEHLQHLTGSYVYIGQYVILPGDSIVQHTRLSHSNPKDWGKVVQRKFSFKNDTLVMVPAEQENASLRLKWVKE